LLPDPSQVGLVGRGDGGCEARDEPVLRDRDGAGGAAEGAEGGAGGGGGVVWAGAGAGGAEDGAGARSGPRHPRRGAARRLRAPAAHSRRQDSGQAGGEGGGRLAHCWQAGEQDLRILDLCPTVFNLYLGIIFPHVIEMGFVLIIGQFYG